jgi:hypothetical protein
MHVSSCALIKSSIERAVILLRKFDEHEQATGLIFNCEKTEHLRLNINDPTDFKLGDKSTILNISAHLSHQLVMMYLNTSRKVGQHSGNSARSGELRTSASVLKSKSSRLLWSLFYSTAASLW